MNRGGNFLRSAGTLHSARRKRYPRSRVSPVQRMEHIADRRSYRRSNQTDSLRVGRERPFVSLVEQSFRLQLLLQSLESRLQRTQALQLDGEDLQLVLAARL